MTTLDAAQDSTPVGGGTGATEAGHDAAILSEQVYRDGIAVVRDALPRSWAEQLDEDLSRELGLALRTPGGVAARGWNRFYFEPYAERLRGFVELASHPVVGAVAEQMLGPDWRIVELGTDIPLPGAQDQPWHRDFPMPDATRNEGRLTSIAVNATAVDVVDGPFQGVLGTHLDDSADLEGGMFPPDSQQGHFEARMQSFHARMGNFSIRSGLMLHRGSAMSTAARMRQVAILGITSPDDRAIVLREKDPADPTPPRIRMSRAYAESLDDALRSRLSLEIVAETADELPPYRTEHSFEGLKMDQRKS
ncbi:phytanoyl-CoA dioxygenase family protein [Cellulomonas fimi]|uniref:Phytanoyl-CoA dioxygenase family protein n=1 Tax=Cellulomonas fimi TaxID=1708 RepID=A0A7Y0M0M0_CELFI|nr:phytanoyl-CoA dioxygenase family protein [Cellulomonas fimi]NMR21641.1 phytanoyl-CoA dioxygenase family protein [Cellulomonas fimi]